MYRLAYEAVGETNVDADRFRAVNEGLFPILGDRIATLRSDNDAAIWDAALAGQTDAAGLSIDDAAKLNRLVSIADPTGSSASDRGAVATMDDTMLGLFENTFGITQQLAGTKEFACSTFVVNDPRFRWVLVQLQAICDFAQGQEGPLPYVLGLDMPFAKIPKGAPGSVFQAPAFERGGENRTLRINTRFLTTKVPEMARAMTVAYRLREGLLNELGHHLHRQGNRPGMIQFRQRPGSPAAAVLAPVAAAPAPPPPPAVAAAPAAIAPGTPGDGQAPADGG